MNYGTVNQRINGVEEHKGYIKQNQINYPYKANEQKGYPKPIKSSGGGSQTQIPGISNLIGSSLNQNIDTVSLNPNNDIINDSDNNISVSF